MNTSSPNPLFFLSSLFLSLFFSFTHSPSFCLFLHRQSIRLGFIFLPSLSTFSGYTQTSLLSFFLSFSFIRSQARRITQPIIWWLSNFISFLGSVHWHSFSLFLTLVNLNPETHGLCFYWNQNVSSSEKERRRRRKRERKKNREREGERKRKYKSSNKQLSWNDGSISSLLKVFDEKSIYFFLSVSSSISLSETFRQRERERGRIEEPEMQIIK